MPDFVEHEVWAVPPDSENGQPAYFMTMSQARWQWAEKFAAYLTEKGHTDVEVRTIYLDTEAPVV